MMGTLTGRLYVYTVLPEMHGCGHSTLEAPIWCLPLELIAAPAGKIPPQVVLLLFPIALFIHNYGQ